MLRRFRGTVVVGRRFVVLLALTGVSCGLQQERYPVPSPLWGGLAPGDYRVGFQILDRQDLTRRQEPGSERPRTLWISLWYPVSPGPLPPPMPFQTYLDLLDSREAWPSGVPLPEDRESRLAFLANPLNGFRIDRERLSQLLATPTGAVLQAMPAPERFPVLYWGVRHQTMVAQSVLSEYLASHGWVVAAVQARGLRRRYPYLPQPSEEEVKTITAWVEDLNFARSELRRLRFTDLSRSGVLSWSYGGLSAVLFAASGLDIRFLVSLDSSDTWTSKSLSLFREWDPLAFRTPVLEMSFPRENQTRLTDVAVAADRWRLTLPEMRHGNFNSIEGFLPELFAFSPRVRWSRSGPLATRGYQWVARTLLSFAAHMKEKGTASDWTPGNLEDLVTAEFYSGQASLESESGRVESLLRGGGDDDAPDSSEWFMDVIGRLRDQGNLGAAVRLAEEHLRLNPHSADAKVTLAEVLLWSGRNQEAQNLIQEVLEQYPDNAEALRLTH